MLKTLYAKNFVLLDELKIDFRAGLNIITGETGAGKSILIGALSGLLGERLSKEIVRSGGDKAVLEGEFDIKELPAIHAFLQHNEIEDSDEQVILRREMSAAGKGRCFINDQPVPVSLLEQLGNLLVDLHGQHEHQLLLQPVHHGEYLDAYLGLSGSLGELREVLGRFNRLLKELRDVQSRAESLKQTRDYLQFQLAEINALDPTPLEDEELKQEENILKHAESIFEKTRALFLKLYESDGSVSETMASSETVLSDLAGIDPRFRSMVADCQSARILIDELASGLRHYHESASVDPDRLEKIRDRLSALAGLKKKYGGSLENVVAHQHKLRRELELVDNLDETLAGLRRQLELERSHLGGLCKAISINRVNAIQAFNHDVEAGLTQLGMEKAKFDVALQRQSGREEPYILLDGQPIKVTHSGAEQIEFLMATNPGEGFKPLADVASGGEISRVMLALKTLLAEVDRVPVLVFDEIDIGISGRIAFAVGRSLRQLAKSHQILCITHLPQIAGMGHHHYLVEKTGDDKTTRTRVTALVRQDRVDQIARLLGGESLTPASRQSAKELMDEAEKVI
jgi:DNA repair protein RecN (Recombination protein N)